jgi:two-component system sensor histidine kinase YesM
MSSRTVSIQWPKSWGELIEQNVQKQQNLQKAEMKTLQAQIAPHFMYNTLDTILPWRRTVRTRMSSRRPSRFPVSFRLSLAKGRDWVSVAEERSHVESYLAIQKMRYGAILEYEIDIDGEILSESRCSRSFSSRWWKTPSTTESR